MASRSGKNGVVAKIHSEHNDFVGRTHSGKNGCVRNTFSGNNGFVVQTHGGNNGRVGKTHCKWRLCSSLVRLLMPIGSLLVTASSNAAVDIVLTRLERDHPHCLLKTVHSDKADRFIALGRERFVKTLALQDMGVWPIGQVDEGL